MREQRDGVRPCQAVTKAALVLVGAIATIMALTMCSIVGARAFPAAGSSSLPKTQSMRLAQVSPIPCHSHNDFWREQPLYSAIQAGCIGVEADVWPYENDLFVAHTRGGLVPGRTFAFLYVEPLVQLLQERGISGKGSSRGIYGADTTQTLVLLVDVKADFDKALALLLDDLQPLRQRGWLSYIEDEKMIMGPITVVLTGKTSVLGNDTTLPSVTAEVFLDAPLARLESSLPISSNTFWASSSFSKAVGNPWTGPLAETQINTIRRHVQMAHDSGLKARYWGLPTWPTSVREQVLEILVREGVDIINVDNLQTVGPFLSRLSEDS